MVLGGLSLFGSFYGAWRRYPVGWDCWTVRRPFGAPTAKSADAQGGDALVGKPCVDGLDGLLRGCGHDLLAFQDRAVCMVRGAYHLGAAGLERSDKLLLCHSVLLLVELLYL